tara:strand:- start:1035 stop:1475 length:441 start_codon:yes stop_codon:yes gene_type:complete
VLKFIIIIPSLLIGQIEKQIRNDDPSLYKNQRVYHAPPKPLYKARTHDLDFLTDIPTDSVKSAILFFKTDSMKYYQEFSLEGNHGLYRFRYDPKLYPGTRLKYYFVIQTEMDIHATPVDQEGRLSPMDKLLIDPVQYFKQQARLNK